MYVLFCDLHTVVILQTNVCVLPVAHAFVSLPTITIALKMLCPFATVLLSFSLFFLSNGITCFLRYYLCNI